MGPRLCFNCFEQVQETDPECPHCGVALSHTPQEQTLEEEVRDYEEELKTLDTITSKKTEDRVSLRLRERDLFWIAIQTSVLGLLQIFTASVMDSINIIAPIFGAAKLIDGRTLIVSGFLYFLSITLLYFRFYTMRRIILLVNIVHCVILGLIYRSMDIITFNLSSEGEFDLPAEVQDFLANITILSYLILLFGIFYVFQSVYMYKTELLRISYR